MLETEKGEVNATSRKSTIQLGGKMGKERGKFGLMSIKKKTEEFKAEG